MNAIGAAAIAAIALRTVLLAVPEQVPFGEEVGTLVSDAALAYAGAWAFHYLVIVRPRRQDRRRIYEVVRSNLDAVAGSGAAIAAALAAAAGTPLGDPPTREDIAAACKAVAPYDDAPLLLTTGPPLRCATWLQYLKYQLDRAQERHERLVGAYALIDLDLVALLRSAAESPLHHVVQTLNSHQVNNPDLEAIAPTVWQYWLDCRAVGDYVRDHVDPVLAAAD